MIQLERITKTFGASLVLDGLSLNVPQGAFVALLGRSGSGKSTLLRIIAGLDFADSGTLLLNGRPAEDLRPSERGVGFVFQNYALFQHMTVAANIAFGLEVRRPRVPRPQIRAAVERLLTMVRLEGLADRLPSQLSGGQRQRVALARSLAVEPQILLLDEPFGALDYDVREELRAELRRLHDTLGMTTLFVTHDRDEAAALADWTVHIAHGRLVGPSLPAGIPLGQNRPVASLD